MPLFFLRTGGAGTVGPGESGSYAVFNTSSSIGRGLIHESGNVLFLGFDENAELGTLRTEVRIPGYLGELVPLNAEQNTFFFAADPSENVWDGVSLFFAGQRAGGSSGNGGSINFEGGNAITAGNGGDVTFTAGSKGLNSGRDGEIVFNGNSVFVRPIEFRGNFANQTFNDTPLEIYSQELVEGGAYWFEFSVGGIDQVDIDQGFWTKKCLVLYPTGGSPTIVGQEDVHPPIGSGPSTWTVECGVGATTITLVVTGAPDKNVDWDFTVEWQRLTRQI